MIERYFDHAATTPLHPKVLEAMLPFLREEFGNANSPHSFGQRAEAAVENARSQLASALSTREFLVSPEQLIFTSGATEANNWVIRSFESIAVSPFEHSSLLDSGIALGKTVLENREHHILEPLEALDLVSVMSVNNETGARYDVREFAATSRHSDITQAAIKYEIDLNGIDLASLSAHKFNGPKGVGALFSATGYLDPLMIGGEQENGYRGGTLNVPGIVGMGLAAQIGKEHRDTYSRNLERLSHAFLDSLEVGEDVIINTPSGSAPHILNISYRWLEGESLVIGADAAGFAISSGAACSSHSAEPSHVLSALGVEPEWIRGTVRISFGLGNTQETASDLAKTLNGVARSLRMLSQ